LRPRQNSLTIHRQGVQVSTIELKTAVSAIGKWQGLSEGERTAVGSAVISAFAARSIAPAVIAELAKQLAMSGQIWQWPEGLRPTGDVASTGGAASLTTLLCPYILATCGCYVPKLSVPGSAAGAIDTLELLAGFRSQLDLVEMTHSLRLGHIAHSKNTGQLAPADGFLFELRARLGRTAVPALVIASLLSKKLAVSCDSCAVDIRCSSNGNLGPNAEMATKNAELYVGVAALLDMRLVCCLTNHFFPPMPIIGRSESLVAMHEVLIGESSDPWVSSHVETCLSITAHALLAAKIATNFTDALAMVRVSMATGDVRRLFFSHLQLQGSSVKAFEETLAAFHASPTIPVYVQQRGFLTDIDIRAVTSCIQSINAIPPSTSDRAGVRFLAARGDQVGPDNAVASLRLVSDGVTTDTGNIIARLSAAFIVADEPPANPRLAILGIRSNF
jgi:thymidine phosphorylase